MPRQPLLISIAVVMLVCAACGDEGPAAEPADINESRTTDDEIIDPETDTGGSDQPAADQPPDDWVSVTDEPSGATFLLPDRTEPLKDTAITEDGGEVELRNYAATTDEGIEVGFNIIETPGESYDLEAGISGVASTLGGEILSSEDTELLGQDAVDVEMSYGDDMFVMFTLISTEDYVMQTLASGRESERPAVEATFEQLTESLEVR
jgi:hypothetical protein